MDVHLAIKIPFETELQAVGSDPRQSRASRFFHDIAELPGQSEILRASDFRAFDEKNIAAHWGPGETDHDSRYFYAIVDFPR